MFSTRHRCCTSSSLAQLFRKSCLEKMEDRDERMNSRLLPRSTKFNWTSEFRDTSFKAKLMRPGTEQTRQERYDWPTAASWSSKSVCRKGRSRSSSIEKDDKRYHKLMEGKKWLISKLLVRGN